MKLIAKKHCSFGGQNFFAGAVIPEKLVADPKMQEKMGVLMIADIEAKAAKSTFTVSIKRGSQSFPVSLTEAELQEAVGIMQKAQNAAVEAVRSSQSDSVLAFVHALDPRKAVKTAAEEKEGE